MAISNQTRAVYYLSVKLCWWRQYRRRDKTI